VYDYDNNHYGAAFNSHYVTLEELHYELSRNGANLTFYQMYFAASFTASGSLYISPKITTLKLPDRFG